MRLVGQKLSITSRKPQTTRQRITGIVTLEHAQLLFVDTPGFQNKHGSALNRSMNRAVSQALADVDVTLMVVEADRFSDEDREIMALLAPRAVTLVDEPFDGLDPRQARAYVMGIDTASGAQGGDYSAWVVLDVTDVNRPAIVSTFYQRMKPEATRIAPSSNRKTLPRNTDTRRIAAPAPSPKSTQVLRSS